MTFRKGQSGNPRGRPKGIVAQARLREALAQDLPSILDTIVAAARAGDMVACKIILDRVLPPLRPVDTPITLPLAGSLGEAARAVLDAIGSGRITPDQALKVLSGLGGVARIIETDELEQRITALESLR